MAEFSNFNPLKVADAEVDEARQLLRTKRSIHAILHSYVSWYDPFAELIQNALDAVDKRAEALESFSKRLSIIIDLAKNQITVSDNGVGLDKNSYMLFLAPNESFKDGNERGSKGVGATFLAYGFNYIQIQTKTKHFFAAGEMEGARRWLHSKSSASDPEVFEVTPSSPDPVFEQFDTGVSITIRFDKTTKPNDLTWPQIKSAQAWLQVLKVKTALGAITQDPDVEVSLRLIRSDGGEDFYTQSGTGYLAPHLLLNRYMSFEKLMSDTTTFLQKKGAGNTLPARLRNLEAVFVDWGSDQIIENLKKLSAEERDFIRAHNAKLTASYMYGAGVWDRIAKEVGYRRTANVLGPGIQMAADNMPQGELIQIPLARYTGSKTKPMSSFTSMTVSSITDAKASTRTSLTLQRLCQQVSYRTRSQR